MNRLGWIVLGAVGGVASAQALRRHLPERVLPAAASALVGAAAVYPVARRRTAGSRPEVVSELSSVAAGTAVAAFGMWRGGSTGRAIVAAGWLGHAGYDLVHHRGAGSRLPGWYPAVCAGFDVGMAAVLAADPELTDG
ncbi:MAG TPA: hypothetical protein VGH99_15865 [Pseudonocardia sp.]|jgi:hypothetical protein